MNRIESPPTWLKVENCEYNALLVLISLLTRQDELSTLESITFFSTLYTPSVQESYLSLKHKFVKFDVKRDLLHVWKVLQAYHRVYSLISHSSVNIKTNHPLTQYISHFTYKAPVNVSSAILSKFAGHTWDALRMRKEGKIKTLNDYNQQGFIVRVPIISPLNFKLQDTLLLSLLKEIPDWHCFANRRLVQKYRNSSNYVSLTVRMLPLNVKVLQVIIDDFLHLNLKQIARYLGKHESS